MQFRVIKNVAKQSAGEDDASGTDEGNLSHVDRLTISSDPNLKWFSREPTPQTLNIEKRAD